MAVPAASRPVRVLLVPPEQWQPERDAFVPGRMPDPFTIYRVMQRYGVEVELFDPHDAVVRSIAGRHPIYTGLDPLRAMKVLTRHRDIDLLLSVFESPATIPLLLRRLLRYRPKIAMWDIVPERHWLPRRLLQRASLPRVDHVFVLSRFHQDYLRTRYGRSSSVVWQHLDVDFFRPEPAPTHGPILAIGDDQGRDFDTFIAAVSDLDVDVVVKTRRALPQMSGRARITQIPQRLSFVELRALYASAALVVVPLHETLNASGVGSILEAMAMARPLVVSDNPPIRDYVVADETALVVPPHDPAALRAAIRTLLDDPRRAATLAAAGRERVVAEFSDQAVGRRMAGEIRRLIAGDIRAD